MGFSDGLNTKVQSLLIELTGGHPYLLQGILEKLWQDRQHANETSVKRATKKFLSQHRDFEHWINFFDVPEHTVYKRLLETQGRTFHINELRTGMDALIVPRIDARNDMLYVIFKVIMNKFFARSRSAWIGKSKPFPVDLPVHREQVFVQKYYS